MILLNSEKVLQLTNCVKLFVDIGDEYCNSTTYNKLQFGDLYHKTN